MWPDRISNPGPLHYESSALLTALPSPALTEEQILKHILWVLARFASVRRFLTCIHKYIFSQKKKKKRKYLRKLSIVLKYFLDHFLAEPLHACTWASKLKFLTCPESIGQVGQSISTAMCTELFYGYQPRTTK